MGDTMKCCTLLALVICGIQLCPAAMCVIPEALSARGAPNEHGTRSFGAEPVRGPDMFYAAWVTPPPKSPETITVNGQEVPASPNKIIDDTVTVLRIVTCMMHVMAADGVRVYGAI